MKKSLLSLSLLFSMWSFAVVISGDMPLLKSATTTPNVAPTAKKAKVQAKKAALHTAAKANTAALTLDPTSFPIAKDSQWSYKDDGTSLDATNWKSLAYSNTSWATGYAPLGYGDSQNTQISYGPDAGNKYVTYYFSKDINVNLADLTDFVDFGIKRDDGAVVYVNGVEVFRDNMPTGAFNYLTTSTDIVDGADENRYFVHQVAKTFFTQGVNRIAVEMHNRDGQSSDIKFDMFVQNEASGNLVVDCEDNHVGCFTSIAPTAQTPNLIIPQEHRFQLMFKEGSNFTIGTGTVPGNHDFTGYHPADGSSTVGRLAVNHENNPGGVSIVNLHLNTDQSLWMMDSSQAVDLYNQALVTTNRNCSGGITPWHTSITAEEATAVGDANGDGYDDVGWLVEIDPITAMVKDYGNGQEKLWAMGRMNHENVVVNNEGTKAYYGEDGGTHCVYKFVPTVANNLTSGNVYVLKMDLPLANDEPSSTTATWVQVPNTTQVERNTLNAIAGQLGGTNFNGVEDCEISPLDGKVYFTSKGKNRVYRFKDNGTTVSEFETFVGGMSYPIETANGTVTEPWGDGNDNITFDDKGNMWLLQDGGKNYIWVVRPDHQQSNPHILLHSSMPAGSEPTGLTFTPDFKYGFFSVQHPDGGNAPQLDATGNQVNFNASAVVVFSLAENLGVNAPMADFAANQVTVNAGQTVTFTDMSTNTPTSWAWTFEGGTPATSTEENPTVTYATAGTYNVSLTATNAIGASEPAEKIDYIIVEATTGLNDVTGLDNVSIYPNPTQGKVTVQINEEAGQNVSVEVLDFLGRSIYTTTATSTGASQKIELNLAGLLGDQVFFIRLNVGDKSGSYKLIKN